MDGFEQLVTEQKKLIFNSILPRYIHAYYKGKGMHFIRRMLADLDNDQMLEIINIVQKPSQDAKQKSLKVLQQCPIEISASEKKEKDGLVMAKFIHDEEYTAESVGGGPATSYRTTYNERKIVIYQGSFAALQIPNTSALSYQIFKSIMHELVHYFESFIFTSDQMLYQREISGTGKHISQDMLNRARQEDSRYIMWKVFGWLLLAVFLIFAIIYFRNT
jgi:hypothetical protein